MVFREPEMEFEDMGREVEGHGYAVIVEIRHLLNRDFTVSSLYLNAVT